ncbi:MAG: MFS transporter [Gemmatimonadales bacterium]|jgi:MFS family permease|nr:MFS transporter [Gemmatimonadales bacterium]
MLVLLAVAEFLGMSLWFSASAVSVELQRAWSLSQTEAGWLTSIVQLGFVAGTATAAVLNLADVVPARRYFAACAVLGAVVNALLVISPGFGVALATRFATGFFLAGVYPPGMKMAATWFRQGRGLAIGAIVGALTVGKAAPWLMKVWVPGGIAPVVLSVSAGALLAAVLVVTGYRDGPYPFARRPFSWSLVGTVLANREWRLATGGYLGHMWELYAYWTWIPVFLVASSTFGSHHTGPGALNLAAFLAIAGGGLGCLWGGWVADRIGYDRLVVRAMLVSGACSLAVGTVFGARLWIVMPVVLVWGFFVIADSAQFSAMVTEVVPQHAVGTALTLQTSLGFLLTMLTMQLVPTIADAGGWRWAFALLAIGPAAGIWSIRRLQLLGRRWQAVP